MTSQSPTFADLVEGRTPALRIREDARHLAFLAPRPARAGHVIVVTRDVVDSVFDLDATQHAALWAFVRDIGRAMRERLPCARVCVSVIGWVVRHAHVHLIPTDAAGQVPGLDGEPLDPTVALPIATRLRVD